MCLIQKFHGCTHVSYASELGHHSTSASNRLIMDVSTVHILVRLGNEVVLCATPLNRCGAQDYVLSFEG